MKVEDFNKVKDFVYNVDLYDFKIEKLKVKGMKYCEENPELSSIIIDYNGEDHFVTAIFCDLTLEDCYRKMESQTERELIKCLRRYVCNVPKIKTRIEGLNKFIKLFQDESIKIQLNECLHARKRTIPCPDNPDTAISECMDCGFREEF